MQTHRTSVPRTLAALISLISLSIVACSSGTTTTETPNQAPLLAGKWALHARVIDGKEKPAVRRQMRLALEADGTFSANYRGDETQQWVSAGRGAFSYDPPYLTFYWNSGQVLSVMVVERDSERFRIHHGRSMVPLNNQEPDELFVLMDPKRQDPAG